MDVKTYIRLVMKKKNLTYEEFCRRINIVKKHIGDTGIFRKPNLAEIFNTDRNIEERTLLIFEAALEIKTGTLTNLCSESITKNTKKNNDKLKEELRNVEFHF